MRRLLAMMMMAAIGGLGPSKAETEPTTFQEGDRVQLSTGITACEISAFIRLFDQHDHAAFTVLIERFMQTGQCTRMQELTVLDVIGHDPLFKLVAVRIKGRPDDWWVISGSLGQYGFKIGSWR